MMQVVENQYRTVGNQVFKEEGQGTSSEAGGGGGVDTKKCATPTISYVNGKISFTCETEGVDFVTDIRSKDSKTYYDDQISLSKIVVVSVYASKDGYDDSDVATKDKIVAGTGTWV